MEQKKTDKKRKTIMIIAIVLIVLIVGGFIAYRIINSAHVGIDNEPESEVKGESRVLVAYFSWSGNLKKLAGWTADEVGGELFRIAPEDAYSTVYTSCASRARTELNDGVRPALKARIPAEILANYDVIYIGYPVWWNDLPMPVWTFLEESDLSGKTVIPFFSHNGTSNGGNSLNRLNELCASAKAVFTSDAISIKDGDTSSSEAKIRQWAQDELAKANAASQ